MDERNPYAVLGVRREAGEAEIHDAYRKLAKRHHPDLNADDPLAESRFKEIAAAYDVLSHKAKRVLFDRNAADAAAAAPEPSFSYSPGRQRRSAEAKHRAAPRLGLGWAALLCLLLALLAILFAWAGAEGMMTKWGDLEIPSAALFFLFLSAALFVMRVIGRVLAPDDGTES